MKTISFGIFRTAAWAVVFSMLAFASAGAQEINKSRYLSAKGQATVNSAKANARVSGADPNKPIRHRPGTIVNIGNSRKNCTLNVGTVKAGEKAPKKIVVRAKTIINYCK